MKFCAFCNNMMYIGVDAETRDMVFSCKTCPNREVHKASEGSLCIIPENKINDSTKYTQYMNRYIKHDSTLPRVNTVECPHSKTTCSKGDLKNEVIYLQYDMQDMKYLYHCCHCGTWWTNSSTTPDASP